MDNKYAAETTEVSSKMFMDEDSITVKKTPLQASWQQSYSYTSKCIPPAQNSLGCCLHHTYTRASWISSSDVNVQLLRATFNGQKMGKLYGDGPGCMQGVKEHLPSHGIQLALDSCPAAGWHQGFVPDPGIHHLKCLIVTMLLYNLKSRSRGPPVSL